MPEPVPGRMIAESGPWRFVWSGGRTADVYHLEYEQVIDCCQVPGWSWEHDGAHPLWPPSPQDESAVLRAAQALTVTADSWIAESEADHLQQLPWMR